MSSLGTAIATAGSTLSHRLHEIGGCEDSGCIVVEGMGHLAGGCSCKPDAHKMEAVVSAYQRFSGAVHDAELEAFEAAAKERMDDRWEVDANEP